MKPQFNYSARVNAAAARYSWRPIWGLAPWCWHQILRRADEQSVGV